MAAPNTQKTHKAGEKRYTERQRNRQTAIAGAGTTQAIRYLFSSSFAIKNQFGIYFWDAKEAMAKQENHETKNETEPSTPNTDDNTEG